MDRLILRQYILGFLFGLQALGIVLMAFLGVSKDILFAVGALFAPIMLLMAKSIGDSDESNEVEE